MILHQFPDLQWLKQQADQNFSRRKAWGGRTLAKEGWPTVILHTKTKTTYRDNIRGPLSLFTNVSGESRVGVEGRSIKIKENYFFLTNPDQHYTLEIDAPVPTQTFNIHFGEYFAEQVFESFHLPVNILLENTFQIPHQPMAFHNRIQPHDAFTKMVMNQIAGKDDQDELWLEETLYTLLAHLMRNENEVYKTKLRLPALKSSTRSELLQRLLRSTDYIFSFYDQSLSLDELAQISCLSKFHFLRLFKIAFQKTPH